MVCAKRFAFTITASCLAQEYYGVHGRNTIMLRAFLYKKDSLYAYEQVKELLDKGMGFE